MRWPAVLTLVAGCWAPSRDTFPFDPIPNAVTISIGCFDVAVTPGDAVVARAPTTGPIVTYTFANRCDRAIVVDLSAARVHLRTADGRVTELTAFDPRNELGPRRMDAGAHGSERILYQRAGATLTSAARFARCQDEHAKLVEELAVPLARLTAAEERFGRLPHFEAMRAELDAALASNCHPEDAQLEVCVDLTGVAVGPPPPPTCHSST